jgi:ribosome-associated translation inhibitor RaiA
MNIDITTEHVAMRPEWHDTIDGWLQACRRRHPDIQGLDVRIRHADSEPAGEAVDLVALARGRRLRATTQATDMGVALCDAFEALEHELALNEALRPRTARPQ